MVTIDPSERQDLCAKLRVLRMNQRECISPLRAIFFGDGTFSHIRGNAPMPKKKILHALAVRGNTVLIDEYKTSKQCPCGASLIDDPSANQNETSRVRVHTTFGDESCAQCWATGKIGTSWQPST